jgi:hypothetical protein
VREFLLKRPIHTPIWADDPNQEQNLDAKCVLGGESAYNPREEPFIFNGTARPGVAQAALAASRLTCVKERRQLITAMLILVVTLFAGGSLLIYLIIQGD